MKRIEEDRTEYWLRKGQGTAIALVHGIGAKDPKDYWRQFLNVLLSDQIMEDCGIFVWKYPTHTELSWLRNTFAFLERKTIVETAPTIKRLGAAWGTTYYTQFSNYQKVILICHSMGGLVVKSWIIDTLNSHGSPALEKLAHLSFYATPHNGAPIATITAWNKQLRDMKLDAHFIEEIRSLWYDRVVAWKDKVPESEDHLYNRYIPHLVVAGLSDQVVPYPCTTIQGMQPITVQGDHSEVICPIDVQDTRYQSWYVAVQQALDEKSQLRQFIPSVAEQRRKQLETFFTAHHIAQKGEQELVRRPVLDTLSQLANEHAIVIVHGLGGCGKTVVLWHWTKELLASVTPQQQGRYIAIMAAEEIQPSCLANLLCDWAHLPSQHVWRNQTSLEYILEHLSVEISRSKHPILYLNIDAIDEEQEIQASTRITIRDLLRWFWKEELEVHHLKRLPQATIVITCRDMKIAKRWLGLNSPFGDTEKDLPNVEITNFLPEELLEAARLGLPKELSARIENMFQSPILQKTNPFLQLVDEEILEALSHPALWGSLLALGDSSVQSCVLDGNPDALHELAKKITHWFCCKAKRRGQQLEDSELKAILATIAHECRAENPIWHSRAQWIKAACSTQLTVEVQAERLYNEALSAGLIVRGDLNSWRWRHQFIGDYLIASSPR